MSDDEVPSLACSTAVIHTIIPLIEFCNERTLVATHGHLVLDDLFLVGSEKIKQQIDCVWLWFADTKKNVY
jgi:hypothetical protein